MWALLVCVIGLDRADFALADMPVKAVKREYQTYSDNLLALGVVHQKGILVGKGLSPLQIQAMRDRANDEGKLWCVTTMNEFSDGVTELVPGKTKMYYKTSPIKTQSSDEWDCSSGQCYRVSPTYRPSYGVRYGFGGCSSCR